MPVTPKEAFGLMQPQVNAKLAEADLLRVGMQGFQQALIENDQLTERLQKAETELAQLRGPGNPPPPNTVAQFPQRPTGVPIGQQ